MMADATELYVNSLNKGNYYYARSYTTDVNTGESKLTMNGVDYTTIVITNIPDGVSPLANEALIPKNIHRRLYIFSKTPLTEEYLERLDNFYGKQVYPILQCDDPIGVADSIPNVNFYLVNGAPTSISTFVEYRYLHQRHLLTNIAYDTETKNIYSLVLHDKQLLVIIMPENFIRTGLKTGYFKFDNNLIIRVYSRYILSSPHHEEDTHEITKFHINNVPLKSAIEKFFARLGMHKIVVDRENQIYTYDRFMTMVVGSTSNIILPS